MIHIVSLALSLCLSGFPGGTPLAPSAATPAASMVLEDSFAEMLGTAVLVWCRPSSVDHGITMLSSNWSKENDFVALTARFRWYGLFSEIPYTSKIRIEVFMGEGGPKVTSVEYKDDCLTPCEMCKHLDEVRDSLNKIIRSAAD